MKSYPDEVHEFIAQNVKGKTTRELVALVNNKFGPIFTESKMKAYKTNHKLKSGTQRGLPVGHATKQYPQEIKNFIAENHRGIGHKDMAALLNENFGTNYTTKQISSYYGNHNLNSGLTGWFPKGHAPFNKGKKGVSYESMKATQFKKGHLPYNYNPVGSEIVNGDGYVNIKIADPNKWKGKHILVWEEHNGPVPPGNAVIFGDGNRRNFDPNNLILVSRKQLAILNKNNLIKNNAELTKTGIIIADIYSKIGDRKKKAGKGGQPWDRCLNTQEVSGQ